MIDDDGVQEVGHQLKRLTTLDISDNEILEMGMHELAKNLKQLKTLNISNNWIGKMGAYAIAKNLTQLATLNISDTDIGETGAYAIAKDLTRLTTLNISDNDIGDLAGDVIAENLKRLTTLDISNNSIGEIGARALAINLANLISLDLHGNNCGIPDNMLAGGDAQRVREYLASIRREGAQRIDLFELLIVGQGVVGKTHLRENLARFNEGELPKYYVEQLDRTHDIDIQNVPLKLEDNIVSAHVWDFGGQQFLHASHRFFLPIQKPTIMFLPGIAV